MTKQDMINAEFERLVAEMGRFHFRESKEVSRYIVKNKLGYKYPNLAGNLDMEYGEDRWIFAGGISPAVYRELCSRLGLTNRRSGAVVVGFTPYGCIENPSY